MDYVRGRIFDDPAAPSLTAQQRRDVYDAMIRTLSQLHAVDPAAVGLADFGKAGSFYARQIAAWSRQYAASTDQPGEPMVQLMAWLPQHAPADTAPGIVHGDFRLDNLIFDAQRAHVRAVLDWELSTLGDGVSDVAYACIPYHLPAGGTVLKGLRLSAGDATLPAGVPTELELVERYCELRGIRAGDLHARWNFFMAFAFFRVAAILYGVRARAARGQASSAQGAEIGAMASSMADLALRLARGDRFAMADLPPTRAGGSAPAPAAADTAARGRRHYCSSTVTHAPGARAAELCRQVEDFVRDRIVPAEPELHRHAADPATRWTVPPLMEALKDQARGAGLWNLFMPRAADPAGRFGAGLTSVEYAPMAEAMGWSVYAAEVFNCSAPDTGNMELLARYGTPEQQDRWLRPLLSGAMRSCFAMTEPAVASSDATNIASRVVRDGDSYVLNGHKWWISGAMHPRCELVVFLGRSRADGPRHAQHSVLLVPMRTAGVRIVRPLDVLGFDDAPHGHAEMLFTDVRVPADHLLLGDGRGFEMAQGRCVGASRGRRGAADRVPADSLGPGRVHHCMRLIGHAEHAIRLTCRRAAGRTAFGLALARHGGVAHDLAQSRVEIEQARLLVLHAAALMDAGGAKAARGAIAMMKIAVPAMAQRVLDRCMQIHGALGLCTDVPLAQMFANARALRIADGPDEVHEQQLARLEVARWAGAAGETDAAAG